VSGDESWILKGICREIESHGNLNARHFAEGYKLPKADYYFFAHYSRLIQFLENPREGKRIVLFTHFEEGKRRLEDVIKALHHADKVICLSGSWNKWLVEQGLDKERVTFVLGGADPQMFHYHERSGNTIGFVSKFYPRKSPDKMLEIVEQMPDKEFILLGREWKKYSQFAKLQSFPNLQYVEPDYAQYPSIYGQMNVFVSLSKVEGGPIPLVEAMMSNVVPVASKTGFAPDLIRHGENGFLFDVDVDVESVVSLIRKAFDIRSNVRETVKGLTWERFVNRVLDFIYK